MRHSQAAVKVDHPERREFGRTDYRRPIKFRMMGDRAGISGPRLGTSANISPTGVLFTSAVLPKIASLVWMEIDLRKLKFARLIEDRAAAYHSGLLGRVVRLKPSAVPDAYDVGVCFVTRDASNQELKF